MTDTLRGRVIAITASRRADEQGELLTRRGAEVWHVPTIRSVDTSSSAEVLASTETVVTSRPPVVVLTTGQGVRTWLSAADGAGQGQALRAILAETHLVARGPKTSAAVRQALGRAPDWTGRSATMEETWRYVDSVRAARPGPVAVQLFQPEQPADADRFDIGVPVYRWAPAPDPSTIADLVDRVVHGRVDAVTFTSRPAAGVLMAAAPDVHELVSAFDRRVLAMSVGPVCAGALTDAGVQRAPYPQVHRLLPMVRLLEELLG